MRVVFDTNVLVAAARSRNGASFQLVSMLPSDLFEVTVSLPLYLEYLDVLQRPDIELFGVETISPSEFLRMIRKK